MNFLARLKHSNRLAALMGMLALAICAIGALADRTAFFAAWLAAWWAWAGFVLGAQANLWLHRLTGGAWISPLYRPLRLAVNTVPILSVLLLPLLLAIPALYPWAHAGWAADVKHPAFKTVWLSPAFFVARLLGYLILWNVLTWLAARTACGRSKGYSAFGLLALGYSISLAAVDLVMSLMPHWYSSGFGLLAIAMQMQAAFALAVFFGAPDTTAPGRRDLGNLLLMYVLMWGYLAFVQMLIIWAENLPDEIAWYVPRLLTDWQWLGIILVAGGFFIPLILLLFRSFKESRRRLRALAGLLCLMNFLESVWLVLPSIRHLGGQVVWMCPLAMAGMGAVLWAGRGCAGPSPANSNSQNGESHARTVNP